MYWRAINWYLQRITGAALLLLLIMHFWVEHFSADVRHGELNFQTVQTRFFHNPWFVTVDILFLLFALYHGLNGLRNIILDYSVIGKNGARVITVVLILIGLVWAWWGIDAFSGNNLTQNTQQLTSANH